MYSSRSAHYASIHFDGEVVRNGGIFGFTWLEDPVIHNLGCSSHSCRYVKPTGMATNGRCNCATNHPDRVERLLTRNIALLFAENQKLQANIEMENLLKDSK